MTCSIAHGIADGTHGAGSLYNNTLDKAANAVVQAFCFALTHIHAEMVRPQSCNVPPSRLPNHS